MFTASENTTLLIVLIAFGVLAWGYYRAKPYGKLGILAWLQSVVLMVPWLIFFTLFALGVYLNLAGILVLLVGSTGLYIYLGKQLRAAGQELEKKTPTEPLDPDATPAPENSEPLKPNPPLPAPSSLSSLTPIPVEDIKTLQGIFGVDTFFAIETIPFQDGAIFKGNLRGDPETVHQELTANLEAKFGERYRLFLVENPDEKPVVIVSPRQNDPQAITVSQKILMGVLLIATLATSLETAGFLLGFDLLQAPQRYGEALPIAAGLWLVLGVHEIAHQWQARRHQIRFSWPFLIPALQLGSFGGFNFFETLLPNRKVLFDVAFAGPAAGGLLSFVMLFIGLVFSHTGSLFQVPSEFFKGSILVGTLARVILGNDLQQAIIDVHPLTIIGWLGLVITAINLMPAGQLDGGRIIQAIYGRKTAGRATFATFIFLAIASFANPIALYWAVVILILQRNLERPSLNELTEVDDTRAAWGLLALFLMLATLLPLNPGLAGKLGIG